MLEEIEDSWRKNCYCGNSTLELKDCVGEVFVSDIGLAGSCEVASPFLLIVMGGVKYLLL